jgi:hypothetical protein
MRARRARQQAFDARAVLLACWETARLETPPDGTKPRELIDRVLDGVGAAEDGRGDGALRLRALLAAGMANSGLVHLTFTDEAPAPLRALSDVETVLRATEDLCRMFEAGRKAEAADVLSKAATGDDDGRLLERLSGALEGMESLMAHAAALAELRGALAVRRGEILAEAAATVA